MHPWPSVVANRDLFEKRQADALELLYGNPLEGDAGALAGYRTRRACEWLTAQYVHRLIAPWAREHRQELAAKLSKAAEKMFFCRQRGVFGMAGADLVVAWEDKCGLGKLCPDEARAESARLEERYADLIAAHARTGRVYKCWLTLPNYPQGRLKEGMRHIFKRFRDRFIRCGGKWGIEGALVILEAPLSRDRDWNVHLNVILLTRGWLSYKAVREAWGANVEVRQHSKFDERGMHGLMAEMVKYSVKAIPEKSADDSHTHAPAMIEWHPREFCEWFDAHHPFRRTRTYGTLYGAPQPERPPLASITWLGRIEYDGRGYKIIRRGHNAGELAEYLMAAGRADLDLIRGDNSTTANRQNGMRGPP